MSILVTGAKGSVGTALLERLEGEVHATDIGTMDVTSALHVKGWIEGRRPHLIYHLAGAKHAPDGERDPAHVARVNIDGTLNVLASARKIGAKVILSSTCKACDPETAYGASKLIAERATLNASGVIVRFHNIPESSGNVFRLWESLPEGEPLPVTDCWRYFTPMDEAIELLVAAASLETGRYCVDPGEPRWIPKVAADLYPGRKQVRIPRRRGDRQREPYMAASERVIRVGSYLQIHGDHDPVPEVSIAA